MYVILKGDYLGGSVVHEFDFADVDAAESWASRHAGDSWWIARIEARGGAQ